MLNLVPRPPVESTEPQCDPTNPRLIAAAQLLIDWLLSVENPATLEQKPVEQDEHEHVQVSV